VAKAQPDQAQSGGDTATPKKRQHLATYSRDKKKGGWMIRVEGPTPNMFAGREVPVLMKDRSEQMETLDALIWFGTDEESGKPVALYSFTPKPREEHIVEF
jgi:hypothetical protein